MRTLFEIVEGAKDGEKPSHEECYFAMLALSSLLGFAAGDVVALGKEGMAPAMRRWRADEYFSRNKLAWNQDPQVWLGDHIPGNPAHDRFRAAGKTIIEKIEAGGQL